MALVNTPAIVLSALRYSETSKIVRLATRDLGVQSAIAKGALRPRSRFGAALQSLSEGQAQFLTKEHRELHTLTAFDLTRLHAGLAGPSTGMRVPRRLAEVMLRFAPADPHPESFDMLRDSLGALESAPPESVDALGLRLLWRQVAVLGFAPSLEACVLDGVTVPAARAPAVQHERGRRTLLDMRDAARCDSASRKRARRPRRAPRPRTEPYPRWMPDMRRLTGDCSRGTSDITWRKEQSSRPSTSGCVAPRRTSDRRNGRSHRPRQIGTRHGSHWQGDGPAR